jgi:hypothetical protein
MTTVTPLNHEEKVAFGEKFVDQLVELLNKAIENLLPRLHGSVSFEIENRGYEDLQVVMMYEGQGIKRPYGFSIDLHEAEQKSIRGTLMVPAWQLTTYESEGPSRWHPEEVWDVPVSVHRNHWDAAAALVKAVFANDVDGWFGAEGEAAAFAEMEEF